VAFAGRRKNANELNRSAVQKSETRPEGRVPMKRGMDAVFLQKMRFYFI
jgi:hypothetical protein